MKNETSPIGPRYTDDAYAEYVANIIMEACNVKITVSQYDGQGYTLWAEYTDEKQWQALDIIAYHFIEPKTK